MAKLVGHRKTKQNKKSSFFPVIFLLSRLLKRSSREEFLNKEIKPKKLCPPSLSLSFFKKKRRKIVSSFFFGPPITSPSSKTGQSNVCYRAKVISKRPLGMCNLPGCLRENPKNLNLAFFFFDWGPIIDAGEQSQRRVKCWEIEVVAWLRAWLAANEWNRPVWTMAKRCHRDRPTVWWLTLPPTWFDGQGCQKYADTNP